MERKQIYMAAEQEKALKELAERRGVSVSRLIREAISSYLVDQEPPPLERIEDHPLWGIVGLAGREEGPPLPTGGSINHDRDLYGATKPRNRIRRR